MGRWLQIVLQKLPASVGIGCRPLGGHRPGTDSGPLVPQLLQAGQQALVPRRIHQKAVHLQPVFLIIPLVQHMLVEVVVVFKHPQLHADDVGQVHALGYQGPLGFHIVIDGGAEGGKGLGVENILQIEQEILTPAQVLVHAETILLHDFSAEELIPQHPIVVVGGVFHHIGGKGLPGHDPLLVDLPLVGDPFPGHPVKIRNHQVALGLLGGADQQPGGVRAEPVVTVQKLKVFPPRLIQRIVAGGGDSGVGLVDHADPRVLPGVLVTDGPGVVLAAVVH